VGHNAFGSTNNWPAVNKFPGKLVKLVPPDVRFYGLNAPNPYSACAPPQTALDELTALPQTPQLHLRGLLLKGKEGNGRGGKGKERKRNVRGKGEEVEGKRGGVLVKCEVKPRARKAAIRPCIDCLYIRRSWAADLAHTKILAWGPL